MLFTVLTASVIFASWGAAAAKLLGWSEGA
jgi:hypothetical protein